jgi:hypothetical protein
MTDYMNNFDSNKTKEVKWFATKVDRCFDTNTYGTGIRIYVSGTHFVTVKGASYDELYNILKVKMIDFNNHFILKNEPDNEMFKKTLLKRWEDWDSKYGASMEDDRYDYKPYALNSLRSLAVELGVHKLDKDEKIKMYLI